MPESFIPLAKPFAGEREIQAVVEVLKSGWWSTGPGVSQFEKEMVEYLGGGLDAVALNSCTAGLFLALKALGVGPGDEVLVPTLTFAATSHVVEWCGAKPVLCDIDPKTLNLSVASMKDRATKQTRVVIPVHIAGYPCAMDEILEFAGSRDLKVVEDAAHAIGTSFLDKKIGQHGDAVVFSFYATKNLACGEGGMVVSKDSKLIESVRSLSYFGIDKKAHESEAGKGTWYYQIRDLGFKFNFDEIHAAIGRVQLENLERNNSKRREIARIYDEGINKRIERPVYETMHTHSRHLYPVFLPGHLDRDRFVSKLRENGIGTSVHFIPLHRHEYFQSSWRNSDFPGVESIADGLVSLPLYPELEKDSVNRVVDAVNHVFKELS